MTALTDALRWAENAEDIERGDMAYDEEYRRVVAAARRVADAPEVWWCETHGVGHRIEGSPAICAASMNPFDEEEDCRMVRRLLVDPGDKEN